MVDFPRGLIISSGFSFSIGDHGHVVWFFDVVAKFNQGNVAHIEHPTNTKYKVKLIKVSGSFSK